MGLYFFNISLAADICTSEANCPPNDAECVLGCGNDITFESTISQDYYNISITDQKRVTITMKPANVLTNYDLYTRWVPNFCPYDDGQGVGWDCKPTQGSGVTETCGEDLSPGMYQVMVKKVGGTTYNLSVSCDSLVCSQCSPNPPVDGCSIKCGQSLINLDTATSQYFKFNLNSPKHVYINLDYSGLGVNYNLYTNWTAMSCPLSSCLSPNCCGPELDGPETCDKELASGTYYIRVNRANPALGNYNLSLICEDIKIERPTIISPKNKTYVAYSLDLTTKCVGTFVNYYINYSLDNDPNITFSGGPFTNNTEVTNTIQPFYGYHNVYFTCYNGAIQNSSDKVYFTFVEPIYAFNSWAEGPGLYTIGRMELANIYVRNTGNIIDSYNITGVIKTAKKGFDSVPQLIEVSIPSNIISSVNNGTVGNTFASITLKGQVDQGNVTFIINSSTTGDSSIATISIVGGSPVALPEFELIGIIQIIIIGSIIFVLFHFKKVRLNEKK